MKPNIKINSITFSDNNSISIAENDIVVLVGPNNSGKSASLKNIETKIKSTQTNAPVIKEIGLYKKGTSQDLTNFLEKNYMGRKDNSGIVQSYQGTGFSFHKSYINSFDGTKGLGELSNIFCKMVSTEARLTTANPAQSIPIRRESPSHPIHVLYKNQSKEEEFNVMFNKAFKKDLVVDRYAGSEIPLYCGMKPDSTKNLEIFNEYIESGHLVPLSDQGDGMRSFVGVLLNIAIGNHDILLIDEPEAFLHPPQAKLLGNMIVNELPEDKQLFIATHSSDFLKGLLDSKSNRVRVIRLNRIDDVNYVSELNNGDIRDIWSDPILRYSNVLDGFHEGVVVCEGDADCRFYEAVKDSIENMSVPDLLFSYSGGKERIKTIVSALAKLRVPTKVIADFDFLNKEQTLKPVFEMLGGDWKDIEGDWKKVKSAIDGKGPELKAKEVKDQIHNIIDSVECDLFPNDAGKKIKDVLKKSSPWSIAKGSGKAYLPGGEVTKSYNRLNHNLIRIGVFTVEIGELERFVPSIGSHGPKWINSVLEEKDLQNDEELAPSRRFMSEIIGSFQSNIVPTNEILEETAVEATFASSATV